jgi:hypothetical protein
MVRFVDRRLLALMEKLLCLLRNLLICGWSKETTTILTPCDLEDGGTVFSKTSANCIVSHPKRQ